MKKYILLRNNLQSGPFSLEDLRAFKLGSKDLVWVEGESHCWLYPSEMEALMDFVSSDNTSEKKLPGRIFVSLPKANPGAQAFFQSPSRPTAHASIIEDSFPTQEQKVLWRSKKLPSITKIASVATVFGGLVLGAFLMKKAVDGYDRPLTVENLPLTVITEEKEKEIIPDKEIPEVNNALLTEIVPVKQPAKKARSASPADLKKQLMVKTSDYSVGTFGGISNLEVKVYNASSHPVDKIVLSIQYMKPKGGVIETGLYEMYSIKPFSGRSLSIPDSKRGVKVKARIVEVRSKEIREI